MSCFHCGGWMELDAEENCLEWQYCVGRSPKDVLVSDWNNVHRAKIRCCSKKCLDECATVFKTLHRNDVSWSHLQSTLCLNDWNPDDPARRTLWQSDWRVRVYDRKQKSVVFRLSNVCHCVAEWYASNGGWKRNPFVDQAWLTPVLSRDDRKKRSLEDAVELALHSVPIAVYERLQEQVSNLQKRLRALEDRHACTFESLLETVREFGPGVDVPPR